MSGEQCIIALASVARQENLSSLSWNTKAKPRRKLHTVEEKPNAHFQTNAEPPSAVKTEKFENRAIII